MDVTKLLTYLDIVGVFFAAAAGLIHMMGLADTKAGKAINAVSIDIVGLIKAMRQKGGS